MDDRAPSSQGRSLSNYLAILLVGLASVAFIWHYWANVNVSVSKPISYFFIFHIGV